MTDPTSLNAATVHVVKATPARPESPPSSEPLRIAYSTTRVMPDVWQRLQRTPGVVKTDRSELAETFKMLRNQVLQRMRADGHRLLAVTSPRSIEGKSLTALNLALAIGADYDSAVLLVDADMRVRGLQHMFGLADAPGLSDHLIQGTPIPDLLVNPGIDRFVFLPAGRQPVLESAELLATRAAQQLIQAMKNRYPDRYIIVDLPSVLDAADALAFLPQVDTTLMVVEEHSSSLADVEATAELLAPFNLIGTVMTKRREPEPRALAAPWYRRLLKDRRSPVLGQRR